MYMELFQFAEIYAVNFQWKATHAFLYSAVLFTFTLSICKQLSQSQVPQQEHMISGRAQTPTCKLDQITIPRNNNL